MDTPRGPAAPAWSPCTHAGWPAWRHVAGPLTLHVVPQIGGRLMGMAWNGHELCFVHPRLAGRLPHLDDPADWARHCDGWHFPLWGGGKTWIAPQSRWPGGEPHRDLDSGAWAACLVGPAAAALQLTSPVCRQSGLQLQRTITPGLQPGTWTTAHRVLNLGADTATLGLWDVLMLRRPGTVTALLAPPDAVVAVEGQPTLDVLVERGILVREAARLTLHCREAHEWKVGLRASPAALQVGMALPGAAVRYARTMPLDPTAQLAHGQPLEVFNAPGLPYFEVESHSPLVALAPGDSFGWRIDEAVFQTEA